MAGRKPRESRALLPSIIYFLTLGFYVYLLAGKRGMSVDRAEDREKTDLKELVRSSFNFIIPLAEALALAAVILLLFCMKASFVGHYFTRCGAGARILLFAAGASLFVCVCSHQYLLLALGLMIFGLVTFFQRTPDRPAVKLRCRSGR